MSTQFSFGRFFGAIFCGDGRRRRAGARVLPRVARRSPARETAPRGDREAHEEGRGARTGGHRRCRGGRAWRCCGRPGRRRSARRSRTSTSVPSAFGSPKSFAPPKPPKVSVPAPPLPLSDPEPDQGARRTAQGRVRAAAARAAGRAEDRAQDRRARAHGRRPAARGKVPRVLGRGQRRADPPRSGRHDVRIQAGRGREVLEDHRPRRRSVPGDAGRIGADRPDSRQVDRRHPDPEPQPRADLPARDARIRSVPPLDVEAHAGARQDDSRRTVTWPTSRRCRTC